MNIFAIAAGMMAVIHLVAGWQRPRLAVIVSGILWLLYAVYERLVATGVLCDADCNIRVEFFFGGLPYVVGWNWCYRCYYRGYGDVQVVPEVEPVVLTTRPVP